MKSASPLPPAPVVRLAARRDRRLPRAIEARRRLGSLRGGRAWINGREVGGADRRFAHLAYSYD